MRYTLTSLLARILGRKVEILVFLFGFYNSNETHDLYFILKT